MTTSPCARSGSSKAGSADLGSCFSRALDRRRARQDAGAERRRSDFLFTSVSSIELAGCPGGEVRQASKRGSLRVHPWATGLY